MPVDPLGILTAQKKADPLGILSKKSNEKPIDFASKYGISNKTPQEQIIDYGKNVDEGAKAKHEENVTDAATNSAKMFFENNPSLLKTYNLSNKKGTGEKFSLTQLKNATPFQQKVAELKNGINSGKYIVSQGSEGQKVTARPKGNLDNFVSGVKDAWNATKEANDYEKLSVDGKIKKALETKPDEYLPEKSDTQSLSYGAGSAIPNVGKITAGAATGAVMSAAAPETFGLSTAGLSGVTAWLMSVPDMAKQGRMNAEIEAIKKLKEVHPDWNNEQLYGEAQKAGLIGYTEGLATGTAMNFIGGGLPANTGQGLWKAAGQFLRNQPQSIAEITSLMGATTYAGEKGKQALGVPITDSEIWDKVGQSMTDAAKMQLAFNVAHGLIAMPKYAKAQANEVLSKIPTEQLNNLQQTAIQDGVLTEDQVNATNKDLQDYKTAQKKIIPTGNEEKDAVITGLIQKKNNLEKLKTETDKSYHDEIDAQIESADQRINLAKNSKDPIKYAEQDDIDGTKHFATKPFEDLSNKEIEGIVVPKEYGETDVKEIGEGENKRYKPIATVINKKGGLEISDKIPVEDKDFSSKEQAQKEAEKALAQHYYENGMDETLKPESKSTTTPKVEESVSSVENKKYVSKFPLPDKPIHEMSSEELDAYADKVRVHNKGLEVEFFGKEGAKKYREAQSISNGFLANDEKRQQAYKTIDEMENSLTPEQSDEFFARNAPKGLEYESSDIRDIASKVRLVEEAENVSDLSTSIKNALSRFDKKNPSNESLAILNAAKKRAVELNINPTDLIKEVIKKVGGQYKDLDDAEFMMKNAYDALTSTPQEKIKELPNETKPQEKPIIKGVEAQMDDRELEKTVGREVFKRIQKVEEQLGEGVVDRNRMIETAKRIAQKDKLKGLEPAAIFEALHYEIGYPDNWQDLRNAIKKGGIDNNSEAVQRQIEVGVDLPKDIIEEFKKSKRYKDAQNNNPELVKAVEKLLSNENQETKIINPKGVEGSDQSNEPSKVGENEKGATQINENQNIGGQNAVQINPTGTLGAHEGGNGSIGGSSESSGMGQRIEGQEITPQGEGEGKKEEIGGIPPSEPPPTEPITGSPDLSDKGILNRLYQSENIKESAKTAFEKEGLKYQPQSHEVARGLAKDIITEMGHDQAIAMAEAGRFGGDVNSMIFAETLDQLSELEGTAKTPEAATEHAAKWADLSIRYDNMARDKGRFISAVYDFYKKSPLGVVLKENINREGIFNDWFKGKEVNYKELFDAIKKTKEGESAFKEEVETQLKEERKTERQSKREKVHKTIDETVAKWVDKLTPKTTKGISKQGIGVEEILKTAGETMKKAYDAGQKLSELVEDAIKYISKELGVDNWDKDSFRKEWLAKLAPNEKSVKTPEEKQKEYLEKFKKKLVGLNDKKKEEIIQKSIKKLIENGALDYVDFKKIIAETLGIGELTPEQAAQMKELSRRINAVQGAAENARKLRTPEGIKAFEKTLKEAEQAAHQLDNMVYVKAAPLSRAMDIIKLNTLGLVSLVKNISYNVFYQPLLFQKGLFRTGLDYSIYGLSQLSNKLFGSKIIKPEANILLAQKNYFKEAGVGLKRSLYQVRTGLQDKDYFSKEVRISQIRPRHAWKDIWQWSKGEKFLTTPQVVDKVLQGTGGVNAEIIARLLNVGDKWQKFGAEGGESAQIATKEFGLKNKIDRQLFYQFPKEEAYRLYKAKGLSDEEASARSEEIEKRISKAGERAITQQDNWLSEKIAQLDKGLESKSEDDPIYKAATALTKVLKGLNSPFVKIPLNVAWNVINFVNPEIALLQSAYYGYQAHAYKGKGDMVRARENFRRSKDWIAHAATGTAMLTATGYLANIGGIRARNDFEQDKQKETQGETNYGRQYSMNFSLIQRLASGGDIKEHSDDVWVDLSWFGIVGGMMNIQAKRVEDEKQLTPDKQKKTYFDDLMSRMNYSASEGLDNGVFSGTNTLLSAYKQGGGYVDSWLLGMSNLGMNFFEPATYSQFSKATMDEKTTYKAETMWQELVNNQKQRDVLFRQFAGQPPTSVTIWGDPYKRQGGFEGAAFNMLGFEKTDPNKFGMIIYNDYARTKNTGFFPPAVLNKLDINGTAIKLPLDQFKDLQTMIGQMRKNMTQPFISNKALFGDKAYSQLNDAEKVEALTTIYDKARELGVTNFRVKYPQYQELPKTSEQKHEEKDDSKNKERLLKAVTPIK